MSRFFAKPGDSSSSEDSEDATTSDSESESEDEKPQKKQVARDVEDKPRGPRKVISAKDKRFEEIKATVKQLKNAMTINDWNVIVPEFQKMNQQLQKIMAKGGEPIPSFYIKIVVALEKLVEATHQDKEKVKKMSKTNAKSLNAMRQNIKKNNAAYEAEIAKFNENPEEEEVEEEESESEESESEESESESESEDDKKKKTKKKGSDSESGSDDDDDSDWGSDSDSSSSEEETSGAVGISKWMKTGKDEDSDEEGFKEVKKKEVKAQRVKEEKVVVEVKKEEMVLSEENVSKKMEEIMAMRGKKGTSKRDQIVQLELLATAKIAPSMTAQVLVSLISAQFDSSMTRGGVSHMPISFEVEENGVKTPSRENCLWTKCMRNIRSLLKVLQENPELTEESTGQSNSQLQQQLVAPPPEFDDEDEMPIQVSSNLVSFVERLDDELYLSLRLEDHHSAVFPKRLLDIALLLELAQDVQA